MAPATLTFAGNTTRAAAIVTAQREAPRAGPSIARMDPVPPISLRLPASPRPLATSPPAQAPPPLPLLSAPTVPVPRAEDSPEVLYAGAETAMRNGDLPAARAAPERVIRTGAAPATASARHELARLAMRARDLGGAARLLDDMLNADRAGALREPTRFLRCRVELDRGRAGDAMACLRRFLQDYPRSVHAAAARQILDQTSP